MKEKEMKAIAGMINRAIEARDDIKRLRTIKDEVLGLTREFPLYPELRKQA